MQPGAAAQPIAAVVTSESSYALRAEAGVRAFQQITECLISEGLSAMTSVQALMQSLKNRITQDTR